MRLLLDVFPIAVCWKHGWPAPRVEGKVLPLLERCSALFGDVALALDFCPKLLDQEPLSVRQELRAGHLCDLLAQRGVVADVPAQEDLDPVHIPLGPVWVLGLAAQKPDVRNLNLAAGVGAARPVHPDVPRHIHRGLQRLCQRLARGLGLDQRQGAELVAGARHQVLHQPARVGPEGGRKALSGRQQGLRKQRADLGVRHVRDDVVLLHSEPDLARAVLLRDPGNLEHVLGLDPARGDVDAHVVQPLLPLGVDPVVVPALVGLVDQRVALSLERPAGHPLGHLVPKVLQPHVLDEPHHAALLSGAPCAEVPEGGEDRVAGVNDVALGNKGVQGDGLLAFCRREEPADQQVVAKLAILRGGHVSQVVDVGVLVQVVRPDDADVPLSGQVGDALIHLSKVDDVLCEVVADGDGVNDLERVDSGDGAPHRVPHVVHAALDRGQPAALQPVEDVGHVLQGDAAELKVLPRGDIAATTLPGLLRDLGEDPELVRGHHAVGELEAHHELAVLLLPAVEEAEPLEPDVDVLGVLLGVELREWDFRPLPEVFHRQHHGVLLHLGLLEVVEALLLLRVLHLDVLARRAPGHSALLVDVLVLIDLPDHLRGLFGDGEDPRSLAACLGGLGGPREDLAQVQKVRNPRPSD
mmetsp:Transcript_5966/g.20562  ORF Transcript_5966/g.20562 Transcript_5966/m.20562 type:complete len:639 (-) Transcript_5966:219-2135(-)